MHISVKLVRIIWRYQHSIFHKCLKINVPLYIIRHVFTLILIINIITYQNNEHDTTSLQEMSVCKISEICEILKSIFFVVEPVFLSKKQTPLSIV